jgi:hypothetical protein
MGYGALKSESVPTGAKVKKMLRADIVALLGLILAVPPALYGVVHLGERRPRWRKLLGQP